MSKVRIIRAGIAGFGVSGQAFHAPFFDADERFLLKKVYERSSSLSKERYPYVEVVRSFDELLSDDIDLVVVSTPNQLHFQMAKAALEAGKAVVVEKPAAASSDEARELCELAKEKGALFTVYQNRRLDGDFRTIEQLIKNGVLGEVLDFEAHFDRYVRGRSRKSWKLKDDMRTSILYDLGVHLIDQTYALFGMPKGVFADFRMLREESISTDSFKLLLYYDRLRAVLSAAETVPMQGPHFMVHGKKGSYIKYGMDVQEKALRAEGKRPVGEDWGKEPPEQYGKLALVTETGISEQIYPTVAGDYRLFYDNLYKAYTENEPLLIDPMDAVDVLRIMEAAVESGRSGRRVGL